MVVDSSALVAILRKELKLERSVTEILQILSVNAFQQTPIASPLTNSLQKEEAEVLRNQLMLNLL